ncbi:hypothetical protein [Mycobacterium sp. Root135]|uniref:hypothetical protein n=1 Tax=Mycobacterium sp. Root135 TaxID=1736457 RepID=UPI0012E9ADC3|nr:hypothetical protein [Mycobacterium sp. Root135]
MLVAVAVLLVIGITIGATLIFTRNSDNGGATPAPRTPGDIASSSDTGPIGVITDEPTCNTFNGINNNLAAVQTNGWGEVRSTLGPVAEWTTEQRSQVEAVATSVRTATDQLVPLVKQTPHRLVRELYEQFIAYGRAYSDSIPNYIPANDGLASVFVNSSSAMVGICNAIQLGSASRSLNQATAQPSTNTPPIGDPSEPNLFVTTSNSTCTEWIARLDRFNAETSPEWQHRDSGIPGSQWDANRKQIEDAARPLLNSYADDIQMLGRQSANFVLEDFANASAAYIRAYLAAGDSYINADGWLNYAAFRIANLVSGACRATAG